MFRHKAFFFFIFTKTLRHRFAIGYIQKWDLHRLWYGVTTDLKRRMSEGEEELKKSKRRGREEEEKSHEVNASKLQCPDYRVQKILMS